MQSFTIAEQHRADCHESDAVSALLGRLKVCNSGQTAPSASDMLRPS